MRPIVFDGLITPIEGITASIAMPMGSTDFLGTFNRADNIASITAANYFQT
jgi:hypothetical protein